MNHPNSFDVTTDHHLCDAAGAEGNVVVVVAANELEELALLDDAKLLEEDEDVKNHDELDELELEEAYSMTIVCIVVAFVTVPLATPVTFT